MKSLLCPDGKCSARGVSEQEAERQWWNVRWRCRGKIYVFLLFFLAPEQKVKAGRRGPPETTQEFSIVDSSSIEAHLCEHFKQRDIVVRPNFVVACNILFCFATAETL